MNRQNLPQPKKHGGFVSKRISIPIFLVFGVVITIWFIQSQAFSSDPSRIGQGKPAAVLLYESSSHDLSANLKHGYKELREKYQDQIEMLVINTLSPNGIHFGQQSNATAGTILYYDAKGKKIAQIKGSKSVDDLEASFKQTFGI